MLADPDEDLCGPPERWVLDQVAGADCLPEPERQHYRAEAERLVGEHAAARKGDPLARTLWYVLRAHLALGADEPVLALTWCVRAALVNGEHLTPDEYLMDLLERGRLYVLLQRGHGSGIKG